MQNIPYFIIIGCQRGGTTSAYNYITEHPSIHSASQKELHYFDYNFNKSLEWYKNQFPKDKISGEASPYYIIHPYAPRRIKNNFPEIKLIALLRNPVNRAYSHFMHEVRLGVETLSFQEALKEETSRLEREIEKMRDDENYYSFAHQHFTYLERGKYIEQLKIWFDEFKKDQILVLKSESLFEDTDNTMKEIFEFLEVPNFKTNNKIFNFGGNSSLEPKMKKELHEFFKPYNEKLYSFLGKDFQW